MITRAYNPLHAPGQDGQPVDPRRCRPYTSLNCTLTLQRSSIRTSPALANNAYARDTTADDPRFVDYYGSTDMVVTSGGDNDSGMFEPNLNDQRFLPFEGAGAIGTWTASLPVLAHVRLYDDLGRDPAPPLYRRTFRR